jgi:predicted nucleic acid-binding protein
VTLVADSSVVLVVLLNEGEHGPWAEHILASDVIAAPHHLNAEVAGVLRRHTLAGDISDEGATAAYARLLAMDFELHGFEPYAARIWELRHTVIIKDAWFVATAESLGVLLATVDFRLTRAPGPRCRFLTPPP